jgi:hypothetical protein
MSRQLLELTYYIINFNYIEIKAPVRRIKGTVPHTLRCLIDLPNGCVDVWVVCELLIKDCSRIKCHLNCVFLFLWIAGN